MTDYEKKLKREEAYTAALNKYRGANKNFGFNFSKQNQLDEAKSDYANYHDFDFDVNKDAFYKDAVEQYKKLGKLAMDDTIGKASAMTGGYGNSYAQSVGQQAYQGQLDNLNDVALDLYDRALERYKMGKSDLYDQITMLEDERVNEYNEKLTNREHYLENLYNDMEIAKGEYEALLPEESSLEDDKLGADLLKILSENPEIYDEYPQLFNKYLKGDTSYYPTVDTDTEDETPKETQNTQRFIERYGDKEGYKLTGQSESEYKAKMEQDLTNFYRDGRISDAELRWLLEYYDISD